jgi:DNA topoisomerase-2
MSNSNKKYSKLDQRSHILLRNGMYIGSTDITTEEAWIYDDKENKIIKKNIKFTPGLLKLFDEIIINSSDHGQTDKTMDTIKVEYNKEEGFISVFNNGDSGIPIEFHSDNKTLIPSMIFGELLSGSNFDDDVQRVTGGLNGLGCKLCNIFSTKFIVDVIDHKNKKHFTQEWTENMGTVGKPSVTKSTLKHSSVKVTFYPDFTRFNIKDLDNDHYNLFYRRALDIAAINPKVNVYFNDKKININNFKSYIELHYPDEPKENIYLDESNDRWQVGVLYKEDCNNETISFVNSINTYHGGNHVTHVTDQIYKYLIDIIKKKNKDIKVNNQLLKDNLVFFINSTLVNPTFASQTKDNCTLKADKFGSKYIPNQTFLKKLAKCGIVEQVIELAKFKESSSLKKTDGKKQIKLRGIPKLDDANKAGTKESSKCSLILCEGDSAKTFCMSGVSHIGRDYYGVFPLKGKLLNTREATTAQLMNNEEINNLKQIIGLRHGQDYGDNAKFNELRYGKIIILTDADTDGSHIKGLLMNFIHSIYPSLIKRDNFITSLVTPILKAFKGKEVVSFYTNKEYEIWCETNDVNKFKIKYYKGLGTSGPAEAKESFIDFEKKLISYEWTDKNTKDEVIEVNEVENAEESETNEVEEETLELGGSDPLSLQSDSEVRLPYNKESDNDAILLAFDKKRANDRKKWLMNYNKEDVLLYEDKKVSYSKFIHSDLIHFSNDDLSRSIPSLVDGLKPSQRKILFGAFLRGLDKDEVKVSQLAGFVSDKAAYHHGEASLQGAIINMAQNYVGSNNINILKPIGQFGSKILNGKDSASPRYIWTMFEHLTTTIFNPHDNPILNAQYEDNQLIEPEFYAPIIPMILVNGSEGIGTGYSTKITSYNPTDIIRNLKLKMDGEELESMDPWYYGFKGTIIKVDSNNYEMKGKYEIRGNKLIITELPITESINGYKEFLEKMLDPEAAKTPAKTAAKTPAKTKAKPKAVKANPFVNYTDNNTDVNIYFELEFDSDYLDSTDISEVEKTYHLSKKLSTTNMHLFSSNGAIKKYHSPIEIINEYYDIRLEYYKKRKDYQLQILKDELVLISFKVKFLLLVIEKKLIINNKKKVDIEKELEDLEFPKLSKNNSYDYLLTMPIYNLTKEKVDQLKEQETDKETEYKTLKKLKPTAIWSSELDELETAYNKWIDKKNKENIAEAPKKKSKK